MEPKQIVLKLVLDALNEPHDISSVEDRVRIQKAIYLAQLFGVNLGYSYSWYVKGPYSTSLTRDYYSLQEAAIAGADATDTMVLSPHVLAAIPHTQALLQRPENLTLSRSAWYELLASLHFLMRQSGYSYDKAVEFLSAVKPHLRDHVAAGYERLRAFQLV